MDTETMTEDDLEAYNILIRNGLFCNREFSGEPIPGSNADMNGCDDEEILDYARLLGLLGDTPF